MLCDLCTALTHPFLLSWHIRQHSNAMSAVMSEQSHYVVEGLTVLVELQVLESTKTDLAKHVMAMVSIIQEQDKLINTLKPDLAPHLSSTLSFAAATAAATHERVSSIAAATAESRAASANESKAVHKTRLHMSTKVTWLLLLHSCLLFDKLHIMIAIISSTTTKHCTMGC